MTITTTKKNIHSVFSKIILRILFTWKTVKLHVYLLIGKKVDRLDDTNNTYL